MKYARAFGRNWFLDNDQPLTLTGFNLHTGNVFLKDAAGNEYTVLGRKFEEGIFYPCYSGQQAPAEDFDIDSLFA